MSDLIVAGAAGRLGRRILHAALGEAAFSAVQAVVRPGSAQVGQDVGVLAGRAPSGILATSDLLTVLAPGAVLVTVAPRAAALSQAEQAASAGVPVLVGTTGFESAERARIEALAQKVPVILAPNLSPGVAVLLDLVSRASSALYGYDLEILEMHHRKKKDAPSGTAWALGAAAAEARGQEIERDAILARAGETGGRGELEIGIQSLRGGDVIGDHTVYLIGPNERLELTHRAGTRDVFADGAIRAARFLADARGPGMYGMADVLGLR